MRQPLSIVQLNTVDMPGGAAKVAFSMHQAYRQLGHDSLLVVKAKKSTDPGVLEMDRSRGRSLLHRLKARLGNQLGIEDYCRPASHRIPELVGRPWDILHIHNLHGKYFDLAALPSLSHLAPTILMLHDNWLQTGHCACHMGCSKWLDRCRHCHAPEACHGIRRLGARLSWDRKRKYIARSRVWITAPSQWLLDEAHQSPILADKPLKLIHNGVDTGIFQPGSREDARAMLGLPQRVPLVLVSTAGNLPNPFKDGPTVVAALLRLQKAMPDCMLLVLCADRIPEGLGAIASKIIARPYEPEPTKVAMYNRAADVLAYATLADTAPLTVIESLACGLPVVASAIGGIPEYVQDGQSGLLVPPGQPEALAAAIEKVLCDKALSARLAEAGPVAVRARFDVRDQARKYLEWYHELVQLAGREE